MSSKMRPPADLWARPGHSKAPHSSLVLEMWIALSLSHSLSLLQGRIFEIVMWCWEYLHGICDWAQLRSLYRCVGRYRDPFVFLPPKTSLTGQFPLLITPATYQPGVACLLLPSLPALQVEGLVSNYSGEAPRSVANQWCQTNVHLMRWAYQGFLCRILNLLFRRVCLGTFCSHCDLPQRS